MPGTSGQPNRLQGSAAVNVDSPEPVGFPESVNVLELEPIQHPPDAGIPTHQKGVAGATHCRPKVWATCTPGVGLAVVTTAVIGCWPSAKSTLGARMKLITQFPPFAQGLKSPGAPSAEAPSGKFMLIGPSAWPLGTMASTWVSLHPVTVAGMPLKLNVLPLREEPN